MRGSGGEQKATNRAARLPTELKAQQAGQAGQSLGLGKAGAGAGQQRGHSMCTPCASMCIPVYACALHVHCMCTHVHACA